MMWTSCSGCWEAWWLHDTPQLCNVASVCTNSTLFVGSECFLSEREWCTWRNFELYWTNTQVYIAALSQHETELHWLIMYIIYIYIIVKWRKLLFLTISVRKSETHGDGDEPERHLPQKLWATSAQSWSDVTLPSVNTQDLLHRVQILNSADYGILKINVSFMSCQLLPL